MAATRFYFDPTNAPAISPNYDTNWEQTGTAIRRKLVYKKTFDVKMTLANSANFTVPITTTQDILGIQFVSDPIPPQRIDASCLFSLVMRVYESSVDANVTLAVSVRVVSNDGGTVRGTLFTIWTTGTEFPLTASAATRIVSQSAVTALTTQPGDRLVVEVGGHAAAPASAQSYTERPGFSAATDFALTAALTTDLNPWCEFSKDLFNVDNNNFRSPKATVTNAGNISVASGVR